MKCLTKNIHMVAIAALLSSSLAIYALTKDEEKALFQSLEFSVQLPGSWITDWDTWIRKLNTIASTQQPHNPVRVGNADRPLHRAYPGMQAIDHVALCTLPTPIEKLESLSTNFNHAVYMKRDDLSGASLKEDGSYDLSNIKYGGNKRRKAEYWVAKALGDGCNHWITFGCAGSNHALLTSCVAKELGCKSYGLLSYQPNSTVVQNNLLWHLVMDTELHFNLVRQQRAPYATLLWLDIYHQTGKFPYVIPTGGSHEWGTLGFVNAGFELKEQIAQGVMPEPCRIYLPCGSCATTLGLALGCKLSGLNCVIVAVGTEPEDYPGMYKDNCAALLQRTLALMQSYDASVPTLTINDLNIEFCTEFSGPDYGVFTPEGREAIELMRTQQNINLDGTYTSKSCAALLSDMRNNKVAPNAPILFWNTYCGLMNEEQLRTVSYEKLPKAFHQFFTEPVQ